MSELPPALNLIAEGKDFALFVTANGESYVLRSKADFLTAHLQGDDAARFRADYETVQKQFPTWQSDQTLAQLWDQGGYSWLAAQEAD